MGQFYFSRWVNFTLAHTIDDYAPYGTKSTSSASSYLSLAATGSTISLRDSFTAQEDQGPDFGLPYIDYGARQYSPALSRWLVPDPMGEKYYDVSPYVYCAGNPINLVDPTGEDWFQNTRTGELYYDPILTEADIGQGYMKGDDDWIFLAANNSFNKSDDFLVKNYSSSSIDNGFVFGNESAKVAMKQIGFESRPLKAFVEVTRITENHPEGLNQVSFQREEEHILSVEKMVFVNRSFEQSIEKEHLVTKDIQVSHFPANIITERLTGFRVYSYTDRSSVSNKPPIKEIIFEIIKTISGLMR